MPHTFLALDMALIPQSTKDYVPTFWLGLFSNDNSRMLIDGYNDKRELVHPQKTLNAWLQWSDNATDIQVLLFTTATEYTSKEFKALRSDKSSIWYADVEGII